MSSSLYQQGNARLDTMMMKSLPPGWTEHTTDSGEVYYYSASTQQTQWDRPAMDPNNTMDPPTDPAQPRKSVFQRLNPMTSNSGLQQKKGTEKGKGEEEEGDTAEAMTEAQFDYTAASPDELTFKKGDIIVILSDATTGEGASVTGWKKGRLPNGKTGLFPENYGTCKEGRNML